MKLRHFCKEDISALVLKSRKQAVKTRSNGWKPIGFWVSDEDDYGWKEWCTKQDFYLSSLVYEHEVVLKKDANILYINGSEELHKFETEYADYSDGTATSLLSLSYEGSKAVYDIDWAAVAKKYDGIIISPLLWDCRVGHGHMWYYGWDVASGCIWRPNKAIEEVKLVSKNSISFLRK